MAGEREFVVWMENQPGNVARIGNVLEQRNVNILALMASEQKGRSSVHLILDKPSDAREALKELGVEIEERDVLILELEHRPGVFAEIANKLAAEGINVDYAYTSIGVAVESRGLIVLCVSDMARALEITG